MTDDKKKEGGDPAPTNEERERDDARCATLRKSISAHRGWVKQYETELGLMKGADPLGSTFEEELGSKLLRQSTQIEQKFRELIEICQRHGMSDEELNLEMEGECRHILELVADFHNFKKTVINGYTGY